MNINEPFNVAIPLLKENMQTLLWQKYLISFFNGCMPFVNIIRLALIFWVNFELIEVNILFKRTMLNRYEPIYSSRSISLKLQSLNSSLKWHYFSDLLNRYFALPLTLHLYYVFLFSMIQFGKVHSLFINPAVWLLLDKTWHGLRFLPQCYYWKWISSGKYI